MFVHFDQLELALKLTKCQENSQTVRSVDHYVTVITVECIFDASSIVLAPCFVSIAHDKLSVDELHQSYAHDSNVCLTNGRFCLQIKSNRIIFFKINKRSGTNFQLFKETTLFHSIFSYLISNF